MQQVDDDVPDSRQKLVKTGLRSFLAQCFLQYGPEEVWHRSQVLCFYANAVESPTCYVELVAQAHIYVGDFGFGRGASRPHGERFQELFGRNQKMRNALFNLGELLLRLVVVSARVQSVVLTLQLTFCLVRPEPEPDRPEPEPEPEPDKTRCCGSSDDIVA